MLTVAMLHSVCFSDSQRQPAQQVCGVGSRDAIYLSIVVFDQQESRRLGSNGDLFVDGDTSRLIEDDIGYSTAWVFNCLYGRSVGQDVDFRVSCLTGSFLYIGSW